MKNPTQAHFVHSNPAQGLAYSFVRKIQSIIFNFRYIEACCHFAPPTIFGKFKPNPEKKIFIFPYTDIKRNLEAEALPKQIKLSQTKSQENAFGYFSNKLSTQFRVFSSFFAFWRSNLKTEIFPMLQRSVQSQK